MFLLFIYLFNAYNTSSYLRVSSLIPSTITPILFIAKANIPQVINMKNVATKVSISFFGTISPYPTETLSKRKIRFYFTGYKKFLILYLN